MIIRINNVEHSNACHLPQAFPSGSIRFVVFVIPPPDSPAANRRAEHIRFRRRVPRNRETSFPSAHGRKRAVSSSVLSATPERAESLSQFRKITAKTSCQIFVKFVAKK